MAQQQGTPKCRLCKVNDASSIGSHIFNRELINWTLNEEGQGNKVDKEVAFMITPGRSTEKYIGRKVSNDKIEETFGRAMTDDEIEENKTGHLYVRKYFLCVACEGRLERIESYSMTNLYNRVKDNACPIKEVTLELSIATCENINKEVLRLYFYSLFWRGMESKVSYCRVKEWQKETLRKMLDEVLHDDINVTIQNAKQRKDEIYRFPLVIYYLTTTGDPSENFIHIDPTNAPYFYLIGDLAIQLFFNTQAVKCHNRHLFGLSKFRHIGQLVNRGAKPFSIGVVSEDFRRKVFLIRFVRQYISEEVRKMMEHVSHAYEKFLPDVRPSKREVKRVAFQIVAESNNPALPNGVLNSPRFKMAVFMKVFIQNAAQRNYHL